MSQGGIGKVTLYRLKTALEDLSSQVIPGYSYVGDGNAAGHSYGLWFKNPQGHPARWFSVFKDLDLDLSAFDDAPPRTMYAGFVLLVNIGHSTYACTRRSWLSRFSQGIQDRTTVWHRYGKTNSVKQ